MEGVDDSCHNILNLVNSVSTDLSCNGDNDTDTVTVTDVRVVTDDVKDNLSSEDHAQVQVRESEKDLKKIYMTDNFCK